MQPVVVAGESFPVSPITTRYIEEYCQAKGLLQDARIRTLAVIDLGDLEILQGLARDGHSIIDLIAAGWKASDLADVEICPDQNAYPRFKVPHVDHRGLFIAKALNRTKVSSSFEVSDCGLFPTTLTQEH